MRSMLTGIAAAAAALGVAGTSAAQVRLSTVRVVAGLSRPVYVTAAPGDNDRLFIVEQHTGQIRIFKKSTGTLNAAPFHTQSDLTRGNEQGLLGLAFHPDYQNNGFFYINYTNTGAATVIRRFTRATDDTSNPASGSNVIIISQPFSNHNGGGIQFGPDGFLYAGMGDGGSANDPGNNAANMNTLLGKFIRIDVDGDDFPTDPNRNFAIPAGNPFAGPTCGLDEIWSLGWRNPWRWSFDRLTGELYAADVGQNAWEEVNVEPANTPGRNYGWRCREGMHNTGLTCSSAPCPAVPATEPVAEYSHSFGCSVTGGYVYRGPIVSLDGYYFYADYCTEFIWAFKMVGGVPTDLRRREVELDPPGALTVNDITSFGEDNQGNVYIVDQGGEVFKIVCYSDCDQSTGEGELDIFDFLCFQNRYSVNDPYACNCDVSTGNNICDIFDFTCFQNLYAAGCNEAP